MLSKPINAQGEIKMIRRIWEKDPLSGRNVGVNVMPVPPWPASATKKQTAIPISNRRTRITITCAAAFLLRMHSSAARRMAASVSSTSPR